VSHDSIPILRIIRRRSVEEARYALGACLSVEAAAAAAVQAIGDAARRDRAAHDGVADGYLFLESFALRVRTGEAERRAAEAALMAAQARSAEARAVVAAARTAAEAVETLMTEREAAEAAGASRREQHALDDMARARFDPGGGRQEAGRQGGVDGEARRSRPAEPTQPDRP
jgi:hypothetical protein